jgi:hypothetical protein
MNFLLQVRNKALQAPGRAISVAVSRLKVCGIPNILLIKNAFFKVHLCCYAFEAS